MRRWQTFSLFALSELVCTKNVLYPIIIPYFLPPSFFPFGALRTDNILHPPLPKLFFFPLSARGPTRRRNSTGLAELWGGWPIEQDRENETPIIRRHDLAWCMLDLSHTTKNTTIKTSNDDSPAHITVNGCPDNKTIQTTSITQIKNLQRTPIAFRLGIEEISPY